MSRPIRSATPLRFSFNIFPAPRTSQTRKRKRQKCLESSVAQVPVLAEVIWSADTDGRFSSRLERRHARRVIPAQAEADCANARLVDPADALHEIERRAERDFEVMTCRQ
jgi:hypothetical protein